MNVREMIAALEQIEDKERIVVLSEDSEGNGFSPFYEASEGYYRPESTWHGEMWSEEDGEDDEDSELPDDVVKAVFLWPVN